MRTGPEQEPIPRKHLIAAIAVIIVSIILLIGFIIALSFLLHDTLSEERASEESATPSPSPSPSAAIVTANSAQLCPTKPSPSDVVPGEVIIPIPDWVKENMIRNNTWRPGCPVPISDLALLYVPYWNCDKAQVETGEMIVHVNVSAEVVTIFYELLSVGYPIYKMNLMYTYDGDDDAAMQNNNTSAFNCRANTSDPSTFSRHSYGKAIDINPFINPYISTTGEVLPPNAVYYTNRSIVVS